MAASAAALKYEVLHKKSIGDVFLTVTKVEISGEAEEYKKGGIALSALSCGLPLGIVDAQFLEGYFTDATGAKIYDAQVIKEKLVLYQTGAEKGFSPELTEAEGKALAKYTATVITIGK